MEDLETLRKQLDNLDKRLVEILDERFYITDKVAAYKNAHNLPVLARERELAVIDRALLLAKHPALKECLADVLERIFAANKTARIFNMQKELPFKKIGIIGLGLIGGSIVKGLKLKDESSQIYSLKRNSEDNRKATSEGYITKECETLAELINEVEIIILASPIDGIAENANAIINTEHISKKLIVIDVASVKSEITSVFEKNTTDSVEFLATHPMAGSHQSGFHTARPQLFVNEPWVITPHSKNTAETVEKITKLVSYLGAKPIPLSASEHDADVATISHLVFVISTYLFEFAQEVNSQALKVAGSGFRTTTRLASGNVHMHEQIVKHNFNNISQQLNKFMEFLKAHPLNVETAHMFFANAKQQRDQFLAEKDK